jgi:hypothetical protein
MQTTQAHALSSVRAADAFLTDHADALPTVVSTGTRRRLAELVEELSTHTADQDGSFIESQSQTQKHRKLRQVLVRDHMRAISRIARAELSRVPDFYKLRIPRGNLTAPKLHAAALGMAQAAAANAQTFIDAGMSPDFVAELVAAADAMLSAIDDRTLAKGRRRGATVGLKRRLSDARHAVRILDAFVTTALQDDTALLANWRLIVKVPRQPRHEPLDDAPSLALMTSAPPSGNDFGVSDSHAA